MSAPSPSSPSPSHGHVLPRWVSFVQDHLFLSALLLAEAYLLGDLMQRGWVRDIQQPATWGAYRGVGVVLFFAAGAMAAGVALRCSVTAASALTQRPRRWGLGLFNFSGLLAFSAAEIWASLSERSANLAPTPADSAVLNLLGVSGMPVSPTVVIVAFILPFSVLYWGFTQQKPVEESAEDRSARIAREEEEARHRARMSALKAAGLRQGFQALTGSIDPLAEADSQAQSDISAGDEARTDDLASLDGDDTSPPMIGAYSTRKSGRSGQVSARITRLQGRQRALMTAGELVEYARVHFGRQISFEHALTLVKAHAKRTRLDGEKGQPWAAPRSALVQRLRAEWGQPQPSEMTAN